MSQQSSTASTLHFSELLPVFPPTKSLFASNLFWPGLLTAVTTGLLWLPYVQNTPDLYFRVIAYYIVLMTLLIFYLNSGPNRKFGPTAFAAILTALILWFPILTAPLPNFHW